jgi:uncharacterized protein (DUF433 family)
LAGCVSTLFESAETLGTNDSPPPCGEELEVGVRAAFFLEATPPSPPSGASRHLPRKGEGSRLWATALVGFRAEIVYILAMNAAAHPRIARDPKVMMGKPVIGGTRVTVETVVRQFAAGADLNLVLKGFPDLSADDVRAALAYAAEAVAAE